jgi:GTP cyclohydrolase II
MTPSTKQVTVSEDGVTSSYGVTRNGVGPLQTEDGDFWFFDFAVSDKWEKYSVVVKGDLDKETFNPVLHKKPLLLRIDSGCETSQAFHDVTCECHEQLVMTMRLIAEYGEGMIINIPRQDGRGMGLPFKLATLSAQKELKLSTVEAASMLTKNGIIDARTYSGVICILKFFDVSQSMPINLATNNPDKTRIFHENGYLLKENIPVRVHSNKYTEMHLLSKKKYLGHKL